MYKSGGCFDRRNSADSATLPLGALDIDENGHVIARGVRAIQYSMQERIGASR
jgi:hypothetical protein